MVKADIIDSVIRPQVRQVVGEAVRELAESLVRSSKALVVFNSGILPGVVRWGIAEALKGWLAESIYEDMVGTVTEGEMVMMSQEDIDREYQRLALAEKDRAFGEYLDNMIMESCLTKISREYEAEENVRLKKEALSKQRRDALAEKKRILRRETRAKEDQYIKEEEQDQFSRVKALMLAEGKPGEDKKTVTGSVPGAPEDRLAEVPPPAGATEEAIKISAPSVRDDASRIMDAGKPGSHASLQDAVKDRIKQMQSDDARMEPKNPLEKALMNLHS